MNSPQKIVTSTYPDSDYYYCAGDSKKTVDLGIIEEKVTKCAQQVSHTIFDTPDFVIDAYLDAINGGSSKDAGIRILSDKYGPHGKEGNTNCNHNPKGHCSHSHANELKADYSCGCHNESPYEKGEHPAVEPPKHHHHHHCADCEHGNPYEKGASAFVEERKNPCECDRGCPYEEGESPFREGLKKPTSGSTCGSDCGNPYECGAFPFKEIDPNKTCPCPDVKVFEEITPCCGNDDDIDKKYTCAKGSDFHAEENCSSCVSKNHSNNNLEDDDLVLQQPLDMLQIGGEATATCQMVNNDDAAPCAVL